MFNPGNYFGVPTKWGFAEPEQSGKAPYVYLDFNVTHVAENGAWVEVQQATRSVRLYCSDGAWPFTKDKLTALGFNGDFGQGMDFNEATKNGVELVCDHESYNGKDREKWEFARGGQSHNPANANTVRTFQSKWKAENGAKPTGRPAAPTPAKQATPRSFTAKSADARVPSIPNAIDEGMPGDIDNPPF